MKRAALILAALAAILTAAAAPVRTANEGFVTNKIAAAATLTPIYSDTPTFSEWVCQPDIVEVYWDDFRNMWQTGPSESTRYSEEAYNPNATNIVFSLEASGGEVTATRTRTDIIGYTLGSQTDKPLQPQGDYAPGDYAAVSNAAMNALSRAEAGLSEWSLTPSPQAPWSIQYTEDFSETHTGGWFLVIDGQRVGFYEGEETATTIVFQGYTATRTRLPTMADIPTAQINAATTTNALQDTAIRDLSNDIPPAVTNIVKGLSLGGIWDSGLEVWWTPRMRNGSLTYEATTNVNLNAEN